MSRVQRLDRHSQELLSRLNVAAEVASGLLESGFRLLDVTFSRPRPVITIRHQKGCRKLNGEFTTRLQTADGHFEVFAALVGEVQVEWRVRHINVGSEG